jgi:hypothetical protein
MPPRKNRNLLGALVRDLPSLRSQHSFCTAFAVQEDKMQLECSLTCLAESGFPAMTGQSVSHTASSTSLVAVAWASFTRLRTPISIVSSLSSFFRKMSPAIRNPLPAFSAKPRPPRPSITPTPQGVACRRLDRRASGTNRGPDFSLRLSLLGRLAGVEATNFDVK